MANQTVNYDTKSKTYVPIWAKSVSYYKGQPRWKNKFQKQSLADFKLGVLKNFVNSTRNMSLFNKVAKVCDTVKKRLQHRCFPVKFVNFLRTPFFKNRFSGYFWGLTRVFKKVQNKNRCGCQKWIPYLVEKSKTSEKCRKNSEATTVGVLQEHLFSHNTSGGCFCKFTEGR